MLSFKRVATVLVYLHSNKTGTLLRTTLPASPWPLTLSFPSNTPTHSQSEVWPSGYRAGRTRDHERRQEAARPTMQAKASHAFPCRGPAKHKLVSLSLSLPICQQGPRFPSQACHRENEVSNLDVWLVPADPVETQPLPSWAPQDLHRSPVLRTSPATGLGLELPNVCFA